MVGFIEATKGAVSDLLCTGAGAAGWVAELYSGLGLPTETVAERLANYQLTNCNKDINNLPPLQGDLPFEGGQCDGVGYSLFADLTIQRARQDCNGAGVTLNYVARNYGSLSGKIISMGYRLEPTSGCKARLYFEAENEAGEVRSTLIDTNVWTDTILDNAYFRTSGAGTASDCGDPLPVIPPKDEHEDDIDIDYDDDTGNPVSLPDLPIKFFKPCRNLDGLRIPFEIDLGVTKICGKAGVGFDIKTIIEPTIDFDVCPSQKESIGYEVEEIEQFFDILPAIGDPVNFPDERYRGTSTTNWDLEDKPIQGVFVRAIKNGDLSKTIVLKPENNSSPNLILPRIGTIFFEYLIEKEQGYETGFSDAIPIKNVGQFIPCPWQFGAVKVHYIKEAGWDMSLFPVARKSCCDACSGNDPNKGLDNLDRCRID